MPSRWRGLSSGSSSQTQRTIVPSWSFSSAPPMPKPSKPSAGEPSRGLPAQVLVLRALDHAEERLVRPMRAKLGEPLVLGHAALRPGVGAGDGPLLVLAGVQQRGALVEGEHDVGTDLVLHLHRHLGREPVHAAVEMGLERDPVVVDVREAVLALGDHLVRADRLRVHRQDLLEADAEGEDLEAAAVGDGRAVPAHERREPARLVDDVGARLQVQVVGVGQDHLAAELAHGLRQHRLDGGLGPDRREGRRADVAVRRADDPGATRPGPEGVLHVEREAAVGHSPSGASTSVGGEQGARRRDPSVDRLLEALVGSRAELRGRDRRSARTASRR